MLLDFGPTKIEESVVSTSSGREVVRLEVQGPLDGCCSQGPSGDLLQYLGRVLPTKGTRFIVVMTRVTYYNELAPGAIAKLDAVMAKRDGGVILAAPPPKIAIVCDMLGIPFSDSEAEALEVFDHARPRAAERF